MSMGSRVYLGRLPYRAQERDIEKFFKGYGKIRDIMLKNGYGFVEFQDYRDADDAVYELNGRSLCGERVIVEHAKGTPHGEDLRRDRERGYEPAPPVRSRSGRDKYGPPTRTDYRLIIENLSTKVSWQDLKDFMRQAGDVTYADAHRERKNEGVVEFATHKEMKRAIEKLDGHDLCGRRIKLIEDSPRGRKRSHSKSHSRSRSHSKRKSDSRKRSGSRGKDRRSSRSHSKTRNSKSVSHSKSPAKKLSRKDDNRSKSRSRSKSPAKEKESRSRSKSPDKKKLRTHGVSPAKKESRSRSKSRDGSRSRSKSGSYDRSRSASNDRKRNGSRINRNDSDGDD